MRRQQAVTTIMLELPEALMDRFVALSADLGGPSAVIERAMLMAPISGRRALLAAPDRGEITINVSFARSEMEAIDAERILVGMSKGAWIRSVIRARLRRAPQLSWDEARANSAARVQLLRICDLLRRAVDDARDAGGDPSQIVICWREARALLEGLRACLVGNLLYWTGADEGP
jgi:MoxR-like ATPase